MVLHALGISLVPKDYNELPWWQEAGPSGIGPFPEATEYFGDPKKTWMVNFRVSSLDAMVAQLRAAGISVEVDQQPYPNGRFARLCDPEGNPLELWGPTGRYARRWATRADPDGYRIEFASPTDAPEEAELQE
jgi:glyoxylase I family protein